MGLVYPPLYQAVRRLADVHWVRLSQSLQARCEIHRVADYSDSGTGCLLNPADDRGSSVKADAELRSYAVLCLKVRFGGL